MKISKDDKRIIKEDIQDLKFLINNYIKEGKFDKARSCELELESLKKRLKDKEN